MKRTSTKKSTERRKKPRDRLSDRSVAPGKGKRAPPQRARLHDISRSRSSLDPSAQPENQPESCQHCDRALGEDDRALFVEEEQGRIFCSEKCIAAFFAPEIERLEKEYLRRLSPSDLSGDEREELSHLRWITLQEPDEVWREKTLTGDHRYTMISEYQPGAQRVWSVCICLFLRGEPSFLYLAFVTRNAAMMSHYRKGERVQWIRPQNTKAGRTKRGATTESAHDEEGGNVSILADRLAEPWTEDETFLAETNAQRREDDIPAEDFGLYQSCLEETLETPDEVWSVRLGGTDTAKLYHFIRYYADEKPGVWFLIVARETDNEEEIEILDAFPTRDSDLVDRYRRGEQEVGNSPSGPTARVIH